ncbi:hypothetical protein H6F67_12580 [Microcoleus sp. FACHB-1515]|uniref:hypothetical protein n=1 Tax=Cyanophyceae TaxID=3028117 RepID=UPI001684A672|nr:hypothetical protein [Microcoleus sp. FACHB-1515]MBD2090690.1 hypothetical protein [Microcoleus sp. FACHB-1515]
MMDFIHLVAIGDFSSVQDFAQQMQSVDLALLAQFQNRVFSSFSAALDNFIQSGQVWAFLIGLVLGYLVRSFTSYG